MKKSIRATVVSLAAVMGLSMAACSPEKIDPTGSAGGIDENKVQIYVEIYNGGTGTTWIEEMASEWNATQTDCEVIITGKEKFNIEAVVAQLQSGLSDTSATVYYTVHAGYGRSVIDNDLLVDLTDVLERDVDGNGKTIGEKLGTTDLFRQQWKALSTKADGSGCYALPYGDSYMGLIYDHDAFLEHNWLRYASTSEAAAAAEDGIQTTVSGNKLVVTNDTDYYDPDNQLLTAGKDGKYGTYDDGQPETYAQWTAMLQQIVDIDLRKAFLWTGMYSDYLDPVFFGALAQNGGTDVWNAVMSRNSQGKQIKLNNGQSVAIDYTNGYLADSAQALTNTLNFMEEIVLTDGYVNEKSFSGQTTHTDAQNAFLLGYLNERANPETAFLVDGVWWENEARSFFLSLENDGEEGRGYGQRDYRFMLLPDLDGQLSTKSHFSSQDCGAVAIAKLPDNEKNNIKTRGAKDFLAYTLKDENLRKFTVKTGVNRAYDYTLTAEDRAAMTPFARAAYDIYHDTENIEIMHPTITENPFNRSSGFYGVEWISDKRELHYASFADCMRNSGAQSMINRWNNRVSASEWNEIVQEARTQGWID